MLERARALSVLDRVEAELGEVEDALRRMDEGTYGRCDLCGRQLDDDQLEAAPTARLCPEHQPGAGAPPRSDSEPDGGAGESGNPAGPD
jgi:RNA polymerase-binding transcription factor DksA